MLDPDKWTQEQIAAFAWVGWCYWAFHNSRPGECNQREYDRLDAALSEVERISPYPKHVHPIGGEPQTDRGKALQLADEIAFQAIGQSEDNQT